MAANVGLPANPAAASALTLPALKQVLAYNHAAPYVQTYFDIAFPTSVGQALDAAIATYFAGQGTPQSIITTVSQAKKPVSQGRALRRRQSPRRRRSSCLRQAWPGWPYRGPAARGRF